MADLTTLKRKRGAIKSTLTTFSKYLDTIKNNDSFSELEISILRDRLDNILNLLGEFNNLQYDIEIICDPNALDEQESERENFETKFYTLTSTAKLLLKKHDDSISQITASQHSGKCDSVGIKLPDISLPKFNGRFEDWLEFRDIFRTLIHEHDTLTDIQKFFYLRGALEGNAAASIRKIQYTASNYTVAWDTLCERFNNPKKLLHDHLGALFFFEPIQRGSYEKLQQLADNISRHLGAIVQLEQSIENWDCLLIFWISQKLDNATLCDWERQTRNKSESSTIDEFLCFLRERANFVDALDYKCNQTRDKPGNKPNKEIPRPTKKESTRSFLSQQYVCSYCKGQHSIYSCEEFLRLSVSNRNQFVKGVPSICANCLREGHTIQKCKIGPCRKCKSRHNTLLHTDLNENQSNQSNVIPETSTTVFSSNIVNPPKGQVLLSTARVLISDKHNNFHIVRALLDCGSQTSFISENILRKLELASQDTNLSVFGISNHISSVKRKCEVLIKSQHNNFSSNLTCYVLSNITGNIPGATINTINLKIPSHIELADPDFHKSGPIDMLIGADLFWSLIGSNKVALGKNQPCLQETHLGWIISGPFGESSSKEARCNLSVNQELLELLTKFWEIEETAEYKAFSQDELLCEQIFKETYARNSDGRFVVDMPLKQDPTALGESRIQAEQRFHALERRLSKNNSLRSMYNDFIAEYKALNHMSQICNENNSKYEYYMPHHGVFKESSLTTKLRVVFDASAPTSNGLSLNNIQLIGPVLQSDLLSIILRFRLYTYVISADIAKMYRQVLINPKQRCLQRILWRNNPSDSLETYELNTVTYGQASASFLSIRCLFQLAEDIKELNPNISRIIKEDFYVDDMLTGANTIQEARTICREISEVLKQGCFELRKWCSNKPEVLEGMDNSNLAYNILQFSPNEKAKTLGLTWSCHDDNLLYNINIDSSETRITKRVILSVISKIFDPLGLLSPCTILAKIMMQRIWLEKISWDDNLSRDLNIMWLNFKKKLPILNKLSIPRRVIIENATEVELHGFCDSSERAYGACLYLRSLDSKHNVQVTLLCAKSKVAPIRTISIPRLELCAAVILSRLANKVTKSINFNFKNCFLWSDSTVSLSWIKTSPNLLKTFTGNRVSEIQSLSQNCKWRYVPTKDNPADMVSKGLCPSQMKNADLWWNGPIWLSSDPSKWPDGKFVLKDLPELKIQAHLINECVGILNFPFDRFSNLTKLNRTVAYMLRFKDNCRKPKVSRTHGYLNLSELRRASNTLIKISQYQSFSQDIQDLLKRNSTKNKLAGLTPFLDKNNILRVGGRLKHSDYKFDKKHPILLHGNHHFTKLMFEAQHRILLHGGPQLLLSTIRNTYWPISGRNLARSTVRKCIRCFRFKAKSIQPIMGNLPSERIAPSSPFSVVGIDYAGPFLIKDRQGRGCKITKCYIGLFVCFSTKAIHLELISSLSSESFIQALRRFISRRGKPSKILSDNGTNFVGAQQELQNFLKSKVIYDDVNKFSLTELIDWQFIPPYSPHFGGIWEAGIKGCKHHLKRVLSKTPLVFEELYTICSQIEAILNSRPLWPLSSDPNDLNPLTPAHFLIGKPMTAAPDHDVTDISLNRLNRYQLVQQMCQHFWQRWKSEYITELQVRNRWKYNHGTLEEGTLVLIKDDHSKPTQWQLGRIITLHPGSDGVCRVASIKTASGIIKRGFPKICPLPKED